MSTLSDAFLHSLAARLDDENTVGVTMAGSFARGEGGRYSDVDLQHYVHKAPEEKTDTDFMRLVNGILVSVHAGTLEEEAAKLRRPEKAIWAIPGLRQARILLDKDGSVASLVEAAGKVDWRDLQPGADDFASYELCGFAEEIHKVLDGLEKGDESKTLYATWGLAEGMAKVVLVQRGVLIPTENAFIDLAQSAAGRDSKWSRQFRLVIGLDPQPPGESLFRGYGLAGLRLYQETAALMEDILQPDDAVVIRRTLDILAEAGY